MSLQIIIGRSGAGKSTAVYEKIIKESRENPKRNYFVIVPDQFTMQTQMDLVTRTECGGIMNIDVLSFGRLAHRIFEETGGARKPVLDDTGKSLILRKVADTLKDKTPIIGANLDKQGYIHEVKSAISEFMQYSIGKKELTKLIEYAKPKGSLYYKLKDLSILYEGFLKYIKDNFITTEESMDILSDELYKSKLIKDSVVIFDGFTGFTPIQNKVISTLMELCRQVIMTLTSDEASITGIGSEQSLFALTGKTYQSLVRLADDKNVIMEPLIAIDGNPTRRFVGKEELAFLEQNLFHYPIPEYQGKKENRIQVYKATDIHDEVKNTCGLIHKLLTEENCCYRDIAIITGDLQAYESEIEEEFFKYNIPFFMDKTKGILLNPFTEFIDAALELILSNFTYESVFRYLRSGLTNFTEEEIDDLENYVLEMGIRGKSTWTRVFAGRTKHMKKRSDSVEELAYINTLREKLIKSLSSLTEVSATAQLPVRELLEKLYNFITDNCVSEKLDNYEAMFNEKEDYSRAKEYGQIYRFIMELLDQVMDLIGNDNMNLRDFTDILDAGFNEIEVGSIPQSVDRVIVGDMERTRLKPVSYLFFLGLNDGFIPKNSTKGGIISDMEREFLSGQSLELAPSKRQQMYIQKFYLYINMTKPSEKLILSFSSMKPDGSANRPSYLISNILRMFSDSLLHTREGKETKQLSNLYEIKDNYCRLLQKYADGSITEQEKESLFTILSLLLQENATKSFAMKKIEQAFYVTKEKKLNQLVAGILYGQTLASSISRMEQYAACAYSFFLQYGISIKERELYGFEDRDIGTIFHGVLEIFGEKLKERKFTWFDFPTSQADEMVEEALQKISIDYSDSVLFDNAQNRYTLKRMKRILTRAVNTISYQLNKGHFKPEAFEVAFSVQESLDEINVALNEEEKMKLSGRIDRLDTYEDANNVYVKVVDYKSGNKDFNLTAFYYGLQLQLVVYLNEAMQTAKEKHPEKEIVPAALLYYHVADPLVEGDESMSEEGINQKIREELRMRGIVNSDNSVITALDSSQTKKSDCIPVEYKIDGSFTANAAVMSPQNLRLISDFASYKLKEMGRQIYQGKIALNPVSQDKKDSCTYCKYKEVCGFDEWLLDNEKQTLENIEEDELLENMKQQLKES